MLSVPDESVGPLFASHPIANIVLITIVDENRDTGIKERSQLVTPGFLKVKHEGQVRRASALFPEVAFFGGDLHQLTVLEGVQKLPEMVVRVTQAHTDARLSDVIDVESGEAW